MQTIVSTFVLFSVTLVHNGDGIQLFAATTSFVQSLRSPVQITAMTCWDHQQKLRFWNELNTEQRTKIALQFTEVDSRFLPWNDPDQHRNLQIVDAGCSGTKALLSEARQLLYHRVKWIVVNTNNPSCDFFQEFFETLQVLISSNLYYLCTTKETKEILIKQGKVFKCILA